MDPKATLDAAIAAYEADDFPEALMRLADYFQWRMRGGFQPEGFGAMSADECAWNWQNAIALKLQGF